MELILRFCWVQTEEAQKLDDWDEIVHKWEVLHTFCTLQIFSDLCIIKKDLAHALLQNINYQQIFAKRNHNILVGIMIFCKEIQD